MEGHRIDQNRTDDSMNSGETDGPSGDLEGQGGEDQSKVWNGMFQFSCLPDIDKSKVQSYPIRITPCYPRKDGKASSFNWDADLKETIISIYPNALKKPVKLEMVTKRSELFGLEFESEAKKELLQRITSRTLGIARPRDEKYSLLLIRRGITEDGSYLDSFFGFAVDQPAEDEKEKFVESLKKSDIDENQSYRKLFEIALEVNLEYIQKKSEKGSKSKNTSAGDSNAEAANPPTEVTNVRSFSPVQSQPKTDKDDKSRDSLRTESTSVMSDVDVDSNTDYLQPPPSVQIIERTSETNACGSVREQISEINSNKDDSKDNFEQRNRLYSRSMENPSVSGQMQDQVWNSDFMPVSPPKQNLDVVMDELGQLQVNGIACPSPDFMPSAHQYPQPQVAYHRNSVISHSQNLSSTLNSSMVNTHPMNVQRYRLGIGSQVTQGQHIPFQNASTVHLRQMSISRTPPNLGNPGAFPVRYLGQHPNVPNAQLNPRSIGNLASASLPNPRNNVHFGLNLHPSQHWPRNHFPLVTAPTMRNMTTPRSTIKKNIIDKAVTGSGVPIRQVAQPQNFHQVVASHETNKIFHQSLQTQQCNSIRHNSTLLQYRTGGHGQTGDHSYSASPLSCSASNSTGNPHPRCSFDSSASNSTFHSSTIIATQAQRSSSMHHPQIQPSPSSYQLEGPPLLRVLVPILDQPSSFVPDLAIGVLQELATVSKNFPPHTYQKPLFDLLSGDLSVEAFCMYFGITSDKLKHFHHFRIALFKREIYLKQIHPSLSIYSLDFLKLKVWEVDETAAPNFLKILYSNEIKADKAEIVKNLKDLLLWNDNMKGFCRKLSINYSKELERSYHSFLLRLIKNPMNLQKYKEYLIQQGNEASVPDSSEIHSNNEGSFLETHVLPLVESNTSASYKRKEPLISESCPPQEQSLQKDDLQVQNLPEEFQDQNREDDLQTPPTLEADLHTNRSDADNIVHLAETVKEATDASKTMVTPADNSAKTNPFPSFEGTTTQQHDLSASDQETVKRCVKPLSKRPLVQEISLPTRGRGKRGRGSVNKAMPRSRLVDVRSIVTSSAEYENLKNSAQHISRMIEKKISEARMNQNAKMLFVKSLVQLINEDMSVKDFKSVTKWNVRPKFIQENIRALRIALLHPSDAWMTPGQLGREFECVKFNKESHKLEIIEEESKKISPKKVTVFPVEESFHVHEVFNVDITDNDFIQTYVCLYSPSCCLFLIQATDFHLPKEYTLRRHREDAAKAVIKCGEHVKTDVPVTIILDYDAFSNKYLNIFKVCPVNCWISTSCLMNYFQEYNSKHQRIGIRYRDGLPSDLVQKLFLRMCNTFAADIVLNCLRMNKFVVLVLGKLVILACPQENLFQSLSYGNQIEIQWEMKNEDLFIHVPSENLRCKFVSDPTRYAEYVQNQSNHAISRDFSIEDNISVDKSHIILKPLFSTMRTVTCVAQSLFEINGSLVELFLIYLLPIKDMGSNPQVLKMNAVHKSLKYDVMIVSSEKGKAYLKENAKNIVGENILCRHTNDTDVFKLQIGEKDSLYIIFKSDCFKPNMVSCYDIAAYVAHIERERSKQDFVKYWKPLYSIDRCTYHRNLNDFSQVDVDDLLASPRPKKSSKSPRKEQDSKRLTNMSKTSDCKAKLGSSKSPSKPTSVDSLNSQEKTSTETQSSVYSSKQFKSKEIRNLMSEFETFIETRDSVKDSAEAEECLGDKSKVNKDSADFIESSDVTDTLTGKLDSSRNSLLDSSESEEVDDLNDEAGESSLQPTETGRVYGSCTSDQQREDFVEERRELDGEQVKPGCNAKEEQRTNTSSGECQPKCIPSRNSESKKKRNKKDNSTDRRKEKKPSDPTSKVQCALARLDQQEVIDLAMDSHERLQDIPGIDDQQASKIIQYRTDAESFEIFISKLCFFKLMYQNIQHDVGALKRGDLLLAFRGTILDCDTYKKVESEISLDRIEDVQNFSPVPVKILTLGCLLTDEMEVYYKAKKKQRENDANAHKKSKFDFSWVSFIDSLISKSGENPSKFFKKMRKLRSCFKKNTRDSNLPVENSAPASEGQEELIRASMEDISEKQVKCSKSKPRSSRLSKKRLRSREKSKKDASRDGKSASLSGLVSNEMEPSQRIDSTLAPVTDQEPTLAAARISTFDFTNERNFSRRESGPQSRATDKNLSKHSEDDISNAEPTKSTRSLVRKFRKRRLNLEEETENSAKKSKTYDQQLPSQDKVASWLSVESYEVSNLDEGEYTRDTVEPCSTRPGEEDGAGGHRPSDQSLSINHASKEESDLRRNVMNPNRFLRRMIRKKLRVNLEKVPCEGYPVRPRYPVQSLGLEIVSAPGADSTLQDMQNTAVKERSERRKLLYKEKSQKSLSYCNVCQVDLNSVDDKLAHVVRVHSNNPDEPVDLPLHRCTMCNKFYSTLLRLNYHIYRRHISIFS